jgi:hypothetical protein
VEEVSVNTDVKMHDVGEEEEEANGGRMDWHDDDNNKGEEEGVDRDDACGQTIPTSIVARVTDSRSRSHTNSSDRPPRLLSLLPRSFLYSQLLM